MSKASWSSDIDSIMRRAEPRCEAAAERAANRIKTTARVLVPVGAPATHVRNTIRTRKEQGPEISYRVLAGSRKAFYAHIVERGAVHVAARPFMTPAAEMERASGQLRRDVKGAFDD